MKPQSDVEAGNVSLLVLADYLEGVPYYDQRRLWGYGRPCCALGWWAHMNGTQSLLFIAQSRGTFRLNEFEFAHLFGAEDEYRTAAQEATLIRELVAARRASL